MSSNQKLFNKPIKCKYCQNCDYILPSQKLDVSFEQFVQKNSLCFLKTALWSLVHHQEKSFWENTKCEEYTYQLEKFVRFEIFKNSDKENIHSEITKLENAMKKLSKKTVLVPTFTLSLLKRNVINADVQPVMYDALTLIFSSTNSSFRFDHFQELLEYYYDTFKEYAPKLNLVASISDLKYQLKTLLPVVKLETIVYSDWSHYKNDLDELVNDLEQYFKYPQLNREDCLVAVSKKVGSKAFELVDYEINSLAEARGYLGDYFSIILKVKRSEKVEEFKMFAKVLDNGNEQLTAIVQSGPSKIEELFYTTIMQLFQDNGLESILDFAPKCYFSRLNDVLVLEDMIERGFRPTPTYIKLTYEEVRAIYFKSAKFHAATFILEDILSKKEGKIVRLNEIFGDIVKDWIFLDKEGIPTTPVHPKNSAAGVYSFIEIFPQFSKTLSKNDLKLKVKDTIADLSDKFNTHPRFRNVICHGDMYSSNTMLKHATEGEPLEAVIVDYQSLRYGLPFQDLLMLIYCNCKKEIRDKYLDVLLNEYFEELSRVLKQFSLNIDEVYSRDQFEAALCYMKPISLVISMFYSQIIAVPSTVTREILGDDEKYNYYMKENRRAFVERMISASEDYTNYHKGLVQDLYEMYSN